MQQIHDQEALSKAFDFLSENQAQQALEIFSDIFTDTEDPMALYGMANCAFLKNDYVTALTQLHTVIEQVPDFAGVYNLCGQISHKMNDLVGAKNFYMLAIEKDPGLVDAQRNFGDVLLELEDYKHGVQAYITILQNHPDDIPTLLRMSRLHMEIDQYQSALLYVGKILARDQTHPEALELFNAMKNHLDGTVFHVGDNH